MDLSIFFVHFVYIVQLRNSSIQNIPEDAMLLEDGAKGASIPAVTIDIISPSSPDLLLPFTKSKGFVAMSESSKQCNRLCQMLYEVDSLTFATNVTSQNEGNRLILYNSSILTRKKFRWSFAEISGFSSLPVGPDENKVLKKFKPNLVILSTQVPHTTRTKSPPTKPATLVYIPPRLYTSRQIPKSTKLSFIPHFPTHQKLRRRVGDQVRPSSPAQLARS
jgi:hypothetical protein